MIIDTIQEELPKTAQITDISYEGSEIILYTKNKEFFNDSSDLIRKIVNKVKKRIQVRADRSIALDEEKTIEIIKKLIPPEAVVKDIYFEPEFAKVVIHAEKPGLVIGKSAETLLSIKQKTFWTPDIKRAPVIDSELIKSIRKMLHKDAGYRKKFLNKVGEKIYSEGKEVEWIRITGLGSWREVGRSCMLLQTPQTRVMLDCGMAVSLSAAKPYPYLDVAEFNIQTLDAVILSHAHMDHCLPPQTPVTMADGSRKPISEMNVGDEVLSMNFQTGQWETGTCSGKTSTTGHKTIKKIKTPFRIIEASPNHRFFTVKNLEIVETEAQDLEKGELLPVNINTDEPEQNIELNTDVSYDQRRKDTVILPNKINENLTSLIGYMQGDGHYRSESSIRITDADKSLLEFYKELIMQVFNYKAIINHHSDKTKNAWVLEINNAKIVRFLEVNFPLILTKTKKRQIPQKILESGQNIKSAYLRGLMDAEGSVSPKKTKIRVTTLSEILLKQTNQLMIGAGIQCTLDRKNYTIHISSLSGIRRFAGKIGFNSTAKKEKMCILTNKESSLEKEIVPITAGNLKNIINGARMFGRVHNSPNFRKHLSLYDWLNRDDTSHCTKRTASNLLEMLESRVSELKTLENAFDSDLKSIRQSLSIPLSSLAEETGFPLHVLQYRESGYRDQTGVLLSKLLREKLENTISLTEQNIEKIRRILSLSAVWEQISDIETLENPYEELIDIEVLPNRNFAAEGVMVHNCGMIPYLYEYGFRGPLYCTRPTRDIAALMQLDYIQICQRENRKAFYSSKGIEEAIRHCVTLEYGEVTDIAPDMRLTLQNAGHLLGSASVHVHIGDGLYNLLYSGDIKYENTKLFEKAFTDYARAEAIIIESTYGGDDSKKPPYKDGTDNLMNHIKRALERGGRVLIPCFAVGRSQDIITILAESDLQVPIYLDGMIWDTTAIHTAYPEYMSRYIQSLILHKGKNPFIDPRLHGIGSQKERELVLNSNEPAVIISTSGMLMGGPAIEYLQVMSKNPNNMLLFVGYQAEGTLGKRIQKGWKEIQLDNGKMLEMNMEVATVSGLGGHSDQHQILDYLQHFKNKPRKIIVNHGDAKAAVDFARTIHRLFRIESVAPRNLETIRLR